VAISGIPQVFGTKAYKNMAVVGATIARTVATWHWLSDALTTRLDLSTKKVYFTLQCWYAIENSDKTYSHELLLWFSNLNFELIATI
jgi:hypothetical protein